MEENKYRHELKYLITQGQLIQIQNRLKCLMKIDKYAQEKGTYHIRSIYFDDYYDRCFYENLSGTDPREKFRIRIYDCNPERISLECKRKECGKTLKTAVIIQKEEYDILTKGQISAESVFQDKLVNKLALEIRTHKMHPKIIVDYERIPFVYQNGNVRITLDMNLASSKSFNCFFDSQMPKRPVMPYGQHLLEVKYDEYLPDFIYRALQLDNLQQTAYSKYFLCRKYTL